MSVGAISVVEQKDGLWRGQLHREASRSPSPDIINRRPSVLKLRRSASVHSEPRRRASSIVQFSLNGTTTSVVVEEAKHELARMLDAANSSAGKLCKKGAATVPSELEECPICYEDLECDGVREGFLTPCGHGFHYVCLFRYLRFGKDYKCPSCRASIRYLTLLAGGQKLPQAELHEILRSGPTDVVFVKPGLFGEDFGDDDGAEHASPPPADEGALPSSGEAVDGEGLAAPEGTGPSAEDSSQPSPAKKPPAITCETVFLGDAIAEAGPGKKIREVVLPPVMAQLVDKEEHITSALKLGYAVQLRATSLNRWFELIGNTTAMLDTDTCTFTMTGLTLRAKEKTGGHPPSFLNNKVTLRFEVDCETRGEDIELACDRAKLYGRLLFKKFPDTHLPLAASNGVPEHDECDEFSPSTFGTRSPTCTAHSGSPATAEARQMPCAEKVETPPPHTPTQVSHAPDTDPKRNGRPSRTHEPTAHSTNGRTPKKKGGCACC